MKIKDNLRNIGGILLGSMALMLLPAVMSGCSGNEEEGLYAADSSNIGIEISASGFSNGLLVIGSAQSSTIFTVTSTTRWTVEVTDCEGSWCQIVYGEGNADDAGHIGDGMFTIEAAPNRSGNDRECNVTVYAIESDGTRIPGKSVEIHLEQDRQSIQVDYAGDVISPFGTSSGTQPTITVKANQAWTAASSHSWVKIVPGSGMDGDSFVPASGSAEEQSISFSISVEGNPGTSTRYAELTISSPTSAFTPIRLNVTQEGSSDTFFVTPSSIPEVSYAGTEIEFQVYSPREDWTVTAVAAGNWVQLDKTSGTASDQSVTIKAVVYPNEEYSERQAAVVFTRSGDMGETVVMINQERGLIPPDVPDPDVTPVVSQGWVAPGWTSSYAVILAYYNSPYHEVVGCGAIVTRSSGAENDVPGHLEGSQRIFVELTDLSPETQYYVRPYIEYMLNGNVERAYGGDIGFRTPDNNGQPGSTPEIGDNTPPSPNN